MYYPLTSEHHFAWLQQQRQREVELERLAALAREYRQHQSAANSGASSPRRAPGLRALLPVLGREAA